MDHDFIRLLAGKACQGIENGYQSSPTTILILPKRSIDTGCGQRHIHGVGCGHIGNIIINILIQDEQLQI